MERTKHFRIYSVSAIIMMVIFISTFGCKKEYPDIEEAIEIPAIEILPVTEITAYSAKNGASMTDNNFIKSYKYQGQIFDIPLTKAKEFIEDVKDAEEVYSFKLVKDTFDIPSTKVNEFLQDAPNATPLHNYAGLDMYGGTRKQPIPEQDMFLPGISNKKTDTRIRDSLKSMIRDMYQFEDPEKAKRLKPEVYEDIINTYGGNYEDIVRGFYENENPEKAQRINESVLKNIAQAYGLNMHGGTKQEDRTDYGPVDKKTVEDKQHPDWLYEELAEEVKNIFQIDKIRVGDTEIELPIPSEFVKIDDSFKEQLEIANSLVPESNTLLSYYLSEKDFGNLLTDEFHQSDKYILIEVFNELKYKEVGLKDYRQFLKSYKKDFFNKFGQQFQENALESIQDISKSLDADIDFETIDVHPLGIYYESKNSLSTGVFSKINYSFSDIISHENIVAAVSTVTKINDKVIFLFLFKTYNSQNDLEWIKATNEAWIKEIEKQESRANFYTDFDFTEFREIIMAFLFLSFIGASYYATKKVYKKYKLIKSQKQTNVQKKDELLDSDELKTEPKIPDPIKHPEILKVNRRIRFVNFLIDSIFIYTVAYIIGDSVGGTHLAQLYIEHPYFVIAGILFILYFFQELLFRKTLGKLITGTHVVNDKGQKPSIMQLVLRNVSRLIPFEAVTYLSKEKRGLHDIISKTYVIKD
jgi:uncharacterized RDD family membrane protein YckC